jgi:hypothetical protein
MTPLKLLKLISEKLAQYTGHYAVAGGLAASFYRSKPRMTNDVDIALFVDNTAQSKATAIEIIEAIGYDAAFGWISSSENNSQDPVALVIGRENKEEFESTIDFLLPALPWVENAVIRAQDNLIDFGFRKIPTLTPEDIITAKAFAVSIKNTRFQDLDDIQSIFAAENDLDIPYLVSEFKRLKLSLPKELASQAPEAIRRLLKHHRN